MKTYMIQICESIMVNDEIVLNEIKFDLIPTTSKSGCVRMGFKMSPMTLYNYIKKINNITSTEMLVYINNNLNELGYQINKNCDLVVDICGNGVLMLDLIEDCRGPKLIFRKVEHVKFDCEESEN